MQPLAVLATRQGAGQQILQSSDCHMTGTQILYVRCGVLKETSWPLVTSSVAEPEQFGVEIFLAGAGADLKFDLEPEANILGSAPAPFFGK